MSIRYEIPGRSSSGGLPILGFDDTQLVDGSLLYIEPARQRFSSVPNVNEELTNYAKGSMDSLTGAALSETNAVVSTNQLNPNTARELTSAGAIHGFFNPAVTSKGDGDYAITLPNALITYINANSSHVYYIDAMIRGSQNPVYTPSTVPPNWMVGITTGLNGNDVMFGIRNLADSDLSAANNHQIYPANGWGNVIESNRDIWADGATCHAKTMRIGLPANFNSNAIGRILWEGPVSLGENLQAGAGFIFYNMYVEDCTVSGRSFSDIQAWRDQQYIDDFAPGGRYAGETWTNPATYVW